MDHKTTQINPHVKAGTSMKLYCTLPLMALLSLSQIALSQPAIPPRALGQVDATVGFCGRIDSKNADRYQELRKRIVAGVSDKDQADARSATEYKESFQAASDELERLPSTKAVEACRAALQEDEK
jgi:hypothetical protein